MTNSKETDTQKWLGVIDKETIKKYLKTAGIIGVGLLGIGLLL